MAPVFINTGLQKARAETEKLGRHRKNPATDDGGLNKGNNCPDAEWSQDDHEEVVKSGMLQCNLREEKGVIDDWCVFDKSKKSKRAAVYKDIEDCRKGKYRKETWEFSFRHAKLEVSTIYASKDNE